MDFADDLKKKTASIPIPSQKIGKPDPIREKIYDMRGLANNNPNTWNEAKLFYRQGKFMEEFSDDYRESKWFSMYAPCYQRLGYDELRTYFTWRTSVRRGEVLSTSLSCVFLHIASALQKPESAHPKNC